MNDLDQRIDIIRHFNRFYTRHIGVLREGLLESPFSLTEARVLYEIAHQPDTTATELGEELLLDPGYLSRMLGSFMKQGLIARKQSESDGRRNILRLTPAGRKAFRKLDTGARKEIGKMLKRLPEEEQERLAGAMQAIEGVLDDRSENERSYILRPHRPGDMGWVVHRHGVLYAREYGWDERFEALVAEIVAKFIQNFDPERERCWIAEMDGENVGSIFLVQKSAKVAKLRLLLVEPSARGLGLGSHLVDECIAFAREAGYRKIILWTNDVLHAARRIYVKAGFRLVHEEPHDSFGEGLVGQTWEKEV